MLTDHSGWFVAPDEDNDGLYDANVDCKWIIYVPRVDILRITIQDMDIQHYEDCDLDYLEVSVYEGLDWGVWYSLFIKNLAHYSSH